jgi:two-component system chemotaxis response regulator CheB
MTVPLRVLIVDDSALYRQAIGAALAQIEGVEVVGTAVNGEDAIAKVIKLAPDLLTLDVEMPVMNGIETLRQMNQLRLSTRAIMVSSLTEAGARVTLDALFEGAFDFITKPAGGLHTSREKLRSALAEKILAYRLHQQDPSRSKAAFVPSLPMPTAHKSTLPGSMLPGPMLPGAIDRSAVFEPKHLTAAPASGCRLTLIGLSTGGPQALRHVLPRLDGDFPCPVIVVQHMPPDYTNMMARRMNEECAMQVSEVADGETILPRHIYIAPGGYHLDLQQVGESVVAKLNSDPPVNSCRPSVDYTLNRAIDIYGSQMLAVIMTGMGKDGLAGCEKAKAHGATVYAQDAETSAVYGMPRVVTEAGLADRVLPLAKIAPAITRHVHRVRTGATP